MAPAEGEPDRKLPPPAPSRRRQVAQPVQGATELGQRFRERRAGKRATSGPLVVRDCLLRQPCLTEVVREQFGLGFAGVLKTTFEHLGDAGVELLAATDQQAVVGGVLHQRVLWQARAWYGRPTIPGRRARGRQRVSRPRTRLHLTPELWTHGHAGCLP